MADETPPIMYIVEGAIFLLLIAIVYLLASSNGQNQIRFNQIDSRIEGISNSVNSVLLNSTAKLTAKINSTATTLTSNQATQSASVSLQIKNISQIVNGQSAGFNILYGTANTNFEFIKEVLLNVNNTSKSTQGNIIFITSSFNTINSLNNSVTQLFSYLKANAPNPNALTFTLLSNTVTATNTYIYEPLLPRFDNHVQMTANQPILLRVLTDRQYANLASNKSYAATNTYMSSGNTNSISFWFNQTENCTNFVYTISSNAISNTPNTVVSFKIMPNVTAKYNQNSIIANGGIC